MNPGELKKEIT
jgi:intraflagellar transport protein 81